MNDATEQAIRGLHSWSSHPTSRQQAPSCKQASIILQAGKHHPASRQASSCKQASIILQAGKDHPASRQASSCKQASIILQAGEAFVPFVLIFKRVDCANAKRKNETQKPSTKSKSKIQAQKPKHAQQAVLK
jgi:hypothetical protein